MYFAVARHLMHRGRFGGLVLLVSWFAWAMMNRFLIAVEHLLFYRLREIEKELSTGQQQIAIVLGHPRSATTNVHGSVSQLPQTVAATNFDFLCPSLILKTVCGPLAKIADRWFLSRYDTPAHPFRIDDLLEEQLWLLYLGCGEEIINPFPSVLNQPEIFRQSIAYTPQRAEFIKKCMARVILMAQTSGRIERSQIVYVGRPLVFTLWHDRIASHFPTAKCIVCVRDPLEAIGSYANFLAQITRQELGPEFQRQFEAMYQYYSRGMYSGIRELVTGSSPDMCHVIEFDEWKSDAQNELRAITRFLKFDVDQPIAPVIKTERHTNHPAAFRMVSRQTIHRDLGITYKRILAGYDSPSPASRR